MKLWVSLAVKAKVRPEERQGSRGTAMLNALILNKLYCLSQAQMGRVEKRKAVPGGR